MEQEGMSAERTQAFYKLKEADQLLNKGKLDQALETARQAQTLDPTFLDVRYWLGDKYERAGDTRRATLEYQEIIHLDNTQEPAWERLRVVDPGSAERLTRLSTIAPDPFTVVREEDEELPEGLDDLGSLSDEIETWDFGQMEDEVPLRTHAAGAEELDSLEDIAGTDGVANLVDDYTPTGERSAQTDALDEVLAAKAAGQFGVTSAYAADDHNVAEATRVCLPTSFLHEEDLAYRMKMDHHPIIGPLIPRIVEFWGDDDTWEKANRGSVHLDVKQHPEPELVNGEVAVCMNQEPWRLYASMERRMVLTILRGVPPALVLTSGVMQQMTHEELLFAMTRMTAMLAAGHVPYLQAAFMITDRSTTTFTEVELEVLELLKETLSGWDVGVKRDDRLKLQAICHTWQQRAELSADRAALLRVGNVDAACDALAKSTARNAEAAADLNWRKLVAKHKGTDLTQLAAIDAKVDPIRDEGYGVYRIQMLRWFAATDKGKQLLAGL
jgi:hypothetical protein